MKVVNTSRGIAVAQSVRHATALWDRSRGLLGRERLKPGEALLLEPCSGIHTFGMGYPIDAIFLNGQGAVVHLVQEMKPMRFSRYVLGTRSVLELPPGTVRATGTQLGDRLSFEG